MTVRKRVQPELRILRFAVEVVELDFLLSCKVCLQDATEIIPSTPLGDVCCSPDSVPPRVFCQETLSSAQAAAPGTVSAPASLPVVPCSLNPPHQRPPYLEARATFSVSPLPRLPWRWGVTHTRGLTQRTAAVWDPFVGLLVTAFFCPSPPASLVAMAVERGDHKMKPPPSEVEAREGSSDSPLARGDGHAFTRELLSPDFSCQAV